MDSSNQIVKFILVILFLFFFILFLLNPYYINDIKENEKNKENNYYSITPKRSNQWDLDYIHIDNNWTLTNQTYDWCNGKGTVNKPYVIENVTIDGGGIGICILIENTIEHFELRNCTLSNAEIGIKIVNATNFKIKNNKILNIKGTNGMNGGPGANGNAGEEAIGISINNSKNILISDNSINNISSGNGGKGGNGNTGTAGNPGDPGGNGGNAGFITGIYIENSSEIVSSWNILSNFTGGVGGDGGNGGSGSSNNKGGSGGSGGIGGNISCFYYFKSTNISNSYNNISNIFGGNGGVGGTGGWGGGSTTSTPAGDGGPGGSGGNKGNVVGFSFINTTIISNSYNNISNIFGGNGNFGGAGGNGKYAFGGIKYKSGNGEIGGRGGDGGFTAGLYFKNSKEISNIKNLLSDFISGNGGNGGNGGIGDYGPGWDSESTDAGDGGVGGDGGNGGFSSGLYFINSKNITNSRNNISNIFSGFGGKGGSGGMGKWATYCWNCDAGDAGDGGIGGDGGNGGFSLGLSFIYSENITNFKNNLLNIIGNEGGDGGNGGKSDEAGAGTVTTGTGNGGDGGNGGNGGNGGKGGNSFGAFIRNSLIIENSWNNLSNIIGNEGGDGGKGGNGSPGGDGYGGGTTGVGGNGGDGGNGGNGSLSIALFFENSKFITNSNNELNSTFGGDGGDYGSYGNGAGGNPSGNQGIIGLAGNDDIGYGFLLLNSNDSLNIFNKIFCINNSDNGFNNDWDNNSIGNFWSYYDGVDLNDNKIGDTPYIISGTAESQDGFPIWDDGDDLAPIINFIISGQYLNTTVPVETDLSVEINCTVSDASKLSWVYLCENSTGVFINRSMSLGINNEWTYILDISSLMRSNNIIFQFFAQDVYNNIGKNDNYGNYFIISIKFVPEIFFNISPEYLNTTEPMETDLGLFINCSISNSSALRWVYLYENSTGILINHSMNFGINNEWTYILNISHLKYNNKIKFFFVGKDLNNYTGINDNIGNNFTLIIGDIYPPISNIKYDLLYNPNYVLYSTSFNISAEDVGERPTGIYNISYRIDAGDWILYTGLFNLSTYNEGMHTIYFNSTDNAGNIEAINQISFYLVTENSDIDDDGLTYSEELKYNTDPFDDDTDRDGLLDGTEVKTYHTNPLLLDTDDDGLTDGEEVKKYETDPTEEDTDDDGLKDGDEVKEYETDPLEEDTDGDGLTDGDEVKKYKTDPLEKDTDGDGYSDYDEIVLHGTDPNSSLSSMTTNLIIIISIISFIAVLAGFVSIKRVKKIKSKSNSEKAIINKLMAEYALNPRGIDQEFQKINSDLSFEKIIRKQQINGQYFLDKRLFIKEAGIEKILTVTTNVVHKIYDKNLSNQDEATLIITKVSDLINDQTLLEFFIKEFGLSEDYK